MKTSLTQILFALAFLLFASTFAMAQTTWYVDDDNTAWLWNGSQENPFQYIQDAIDVALDGDTVLVLPGYYIENIDFLGKAITLTSQNGAAETTIDGNQAGSVVKFEGGEGPDSILYGFTITNGSGTFTGGYVYPGYYGGGVFCVNSSPTIQNSVIINNEGEIGRGIGCYLSSAIIVGNVICYNGEGFNYTKGGGIASNGGVPLITLNTIFENSASWGGGIYCINSNSNITDNTINENCGGGIYCDNSNSNITNNTINGNHSGRGIHCRNSSPTITHNTINSNSTSYNGGGIYMYKSSQTIAHNTITGNRAFNAGGINCVYSSPIIANNTVCGNTASRGGFGGIGGGIRCDHCSPTITNNTIHGNRAGYGGGLYCMADSFPVVSNTIIWGNSAKFTHGIEAPPTLDVSYCNIQDGWPGEGNIEAEPLFVDAENGDFHLRFDSPCLDAGNSEALGLLEIDYEGDFRIVDGNGDGFATVDMGADELLPEIAARFGNVSASWPSLGNLLKINDSSGNHKRVYSIPPGNRITLTLNSPPSGPNPAEFVLFSINWEPGTSDIADQPFDIGISCMPMPLSNLVNGNPPYPPPLTLANTFGHNWLMGNPLIPGVPPPPCTVFDAPQLPSGTYTFQGYIMDNGSACSFAPISLTNAIVLKVQ